jgi:hypothetical protein
MSKPKKRTFQQEIIEIITPAFEKFKTLSPQKQQKFLGFIDRLLADEPDQDIREFNLQLKGVFQLIAHKSEVENG